MKKSKIITKEKESSLKSLNNEIFKKTNKMNSIIVSFLIAFILFFVSYDYSILKNRIETQIPIISFQLDSLSVFLEQKTPEINEFLKEQNTEIQNIVAK